jgi:hypothetical protein
MRVTGGIAARSIDGDAAINTADGRGAAAVVRSGGSSGRGCAHDQRRRRRAQQLHAPTRRSFDDLAVCVLRRHGDGARRRGHVRLGSGAADGEMARAPDPVGVAVARPKVVRHACRVARPALHERLREPCVPNAYLRVPCEASRDRDFICAADPGVAVSFRGTSTYRLPGNRDSPVTLSHVPATLLRCAKSGTARHGRVHARLSRKGGSVRLV